MNKVQNNNYFTKYSDEWLEINLYLGIRVLWKNRKTKAKIKAIASGDNTQYIKFEEGKEIDIDKEIKIIEYKFEINCKNITDQLIGFCECEIEGQKKV